MTKQNFDQGLDFRKVKRDWNTREVDKKAEVELSFGHISVFRSQYDGFK